MCFVDPRQRILHASSLFLLLKNHIVLSQKPFVHAHTAYFTCARSQHAPQLRLFPCLRPFHIGPLDLLSLQSFTALKSPKGSIFTIGWNLHTHTDSSHPHNLQGRVGAICRNNRGNNRGQSPIYSESGYRHLHADAAYADAHPDKVGPVTPIMHRPLSPVNRNPRLCNVSVGPPILPDPLPEKTSHY